MWILELRLSFLFLQSLDDHISEPRLSELLVLSKLCKIDIVVVTAELALHRQPLQGLLVLNKVVILHIAPLLIDISLIKIIFIERDKWSLQLLLIKFFPREVTQPGVVLDISGPIN